MAVFDGAVRICTSGIDFFRQFGMMLKRRDEKEKRNVIWIHCGAAAGAVGGLR